MSSIAFSHRSFAHVYSHMGPWATPGLLLLREIGEINRERRDLGHHLSAFLERRRCLVRQCGRRCWHRRWRGNWHRCRCDPLHWHCR